MRLFAGVPASAGVAGGAWVRIVAARPGPPAAGSAPARRPRRSRALELRRSAAAEELDALAARLTADGHPDEGAIFARPGDDGPRPGARRHGRGARSARGHDAIGAVQARRRGLADQLRALGDELLAARVPRTCSTSSAGSPGRLPGVAIPEHRRSAGRRSSWPTDLAAVGDCDAAPRPVARARAGGGFADGARRDPRPRLRDPGGRRCRRACWRASSRDRDRPAARAGRLGRWDRRRCVIVPTRTR